MNIQKVQWHNSESAVNMSFPITKIDKEKRTVSGFATLDNIDRHGDVVTAEASEKAFANFRRNLRQMHQPIAVGKVLSFHPEDFYDKEANKTYKGIYVTAYVSKGAQDTWEKCLDGTFTGFSIGGNIVQSSFEPGDTDKSHRVIKEYDLMELSLVDTPANPLANILSIEKNADGNFMFKGMVADTSVENVFWCKTDKIASSSIDSSKDCVICGAGMDSVGWIETSETEKGLAISKIIDSYLKKDDAPGPSHEATTREGDAGVVDSNATINLYPDQNKIKNSGSIKDSDIKINKGGNMADETNNETAVVEAAEAVVEKAAEEVAAEVATEAAPAEELVEKSVTSAEAEQPFAKMLTEMRDLFGEAINKNSADVEAKLQKSVDSVASARSEMEGAVSDIKKELTALTNNIADFFKRFEELEKRFSSYEGDTAVQKSIGDVDSASRDTRLQKNLEFDWQGSFLGVQNL